MQQVGAMFPLIFSFHVWNEFWYVQHQYQGDVQLRATSATKNLNCRSDLSSFLYPSTKGLLKLHLWLTLLCIYFHNLKSNAGPCIIFCYKSYVDNCHLAFEWSEFSNLQDYIITLSARESDQGFVSN